jgi:hypothetical protein
MGSLIKTGEVVKADPRDIIYFYRFLKNYMIWNLDEYTNFLRKVKGKFTNYSYVDIFPLNLLLIHESVYSPLYQRIRGIKVEQADKIKYENFSRFNVYKFDRDSDGEVLEVRFEVEFGACQLNDGRMAARIWQLDIELLESEPYPSKDNTDETVIKVEHHGFTTRIYGGTTDIEDLQGYLRTLRWTQGKSYSKLSEHSRPDRTGVGYKIRQLEQRLLLFANFFYTLYTDGFEKNNPSYVLLEPFIKLLKTYGDTFEEVLSTINEVVTLVG